jgi:hypothetical protein
MAVRDGPWRLVRFALAGKPLPGTALALEQSRVGTSAAPAGLSPSWRMQM